METADAIVTDALQELIIQASESSINPDEAQTAIRYLNRMMARLAARGINLGYTNVSSLGDLITVPDGAISGIITNLAVELGNQYGVIISPGLAARASAGTDAMLDLAFVIVPTRFPDTLPRGSGNTGEFGTFNSTFYPGSSDDILNEAGNGIELEPGT